MVLLAIVVLQVIFHHGEFASEKSHDHQLLSGTVNFVMYLAVYKVVDSSCYYVSTAMTIN